MIDAFSLKFQKNNQENTSAGDSARESRIKSLYFQCTVKTKQPHTMTEPIASIDYI